MAFSDDMIRAVAHTGTYSDEAAATLLADVLIQRRDSIGRAYLNAINPVVNFALADDGTFAFENAAVAAGVGTAPERGYSVSFARFDNTTREAAAIGSPVLSTATKVKAPAALPSSPGTFIKIQVAAWQPSIPAWAVPVDVYFRRNASGWTLVGVERLPDGSHATTTER
jgi:hypothetical protein